MRALVISGGGSKGAYAGGVAEYLIRVLQYKYDIFVGTSTGSLLLTHLAVGHIDELHHLYTHVNQQSIFSRNPFVIRKKKGRSYVTINYFNTVIQFIKRKRTFGESENLKKLIKKSLTREVFENARAHTKDIVVTVSNLSKNRIEYKSIHDFDYEDFCDWVWISCNYVPFMSLVERNGCEYADGGFGTLVPIREAIRRGATTVDAIILKTEKPEHRQVLGKNPFSLLMNLFQFMLAQNAKSDIVKGDLAAQLKNVDLNLYYTPSKLIDNSLIFDKELMTRWWQQGYEYAKIKSEENRKKSRVEKWIEYFKRKRPFSSKTN